MIILEAPGGSGTSKFVLGGFMNVERGIESFRLDMAGINELQNFGGKYDSYTGAFSFTTEHIDTKLLSFYPDSDMPIQGYNVLTGQYETGTFGGTVVRTTYTLGGMSFAGGGSDRLNEANDIFGYSTFIPGIAIGAVTETKFGRLNSMGGDYVYKTTPRMQQWQAVRNMAKTASRLKFAGNALGGIGVGLTIGKISSQGLTTSNSLDLVMGFVSFVPGWGWAAGAGYFLANEAFKAYNGKDIGQNIDAWAESW